METTGLPKIVSFAILVDQPHHLVVVTHQIGGKPQADHQVDTVVEKAVDVETGRRDRLIDDQFGGTGIEGDGYEFGFVTGIAQRRNEVLRMDLRTARDEGHLGVDNGNAHLIAVRR